MLMHQQATVEHERYAVGHGILPEPPGHECAATAG